MKEYGDERFIYMINQEQQPVTDESNDIRNGFAVIDGNRVQFAERAVIEDKLFITMPSGFTIMPPEAAKIKYPAENRPSIIFSDESGATTLNFIPRDEGLEPEDVEDAKNAIQQLIQKIHPSYKIINSNVIEASGIQVGYFDFVSNAIDGEIYNLMFMFPFNNRLMLSTFNCLHVDMAAWLEVTEQMMQSIRIS